MGAVPKKETAEEEKKVTPEEIRKQMMGSAGISHGAQPVSARTNVKIVTETDSNAQPAHPDVILQWIRSDVPQGELKYIVLESTDCSGMMATSNEHAEFMQAAAMPEGAVPPEGFDLEYREGSRNEHFAVPRLVSLKEVEQALLKYAAGDQSFKKDFEWQKLSQEDAETESGETGAKTLPGSAEATYADAERAMNARDYVKGFSLAKDASAKGHSGARGYAGFCCWFGLGTERNIEAAQAHFEAAINSKDGRCKGQGIAKLCLAEMIYKGDATGHSKQEILPLLLSAVDLGIEPAVVAEFLEALAEEHLLEGGGEDSLSQALEYAKRAVEMGSAKGPSIVSEISALIDARAQT
jgi:hypothetical protein